MYTAQRNAHGNIIVCKGDRVRNSYTIIYTGSYDDCNMVKSGMITRGGTNMEYGIEIMLQEFDQNFERAIAYCQRQVWMAGINGNARFEREYGELTSQLIALRTSRIKESKRDQYELRLQKTDIS